MKHLLIIPTIILLTHLLHGQVEIDQPINLTGGSGQRSVTNLELPVNSTDAASKEYVDNEIASLGGGGMLHAQNMTTSERDNLTPSPGDIIFNTDQSCFNMYTGTSWLLLCDEYVGTTFGIPYDNGNDAYWTERNNGYRDIFIRENQKFYTWNSSDLVYSRTTSSGTFILVPSRTTTEVNASSFYGYSGGSASGSNFQWDEQTVSPSAYDVDKLFVSPSLSTMTYCRALQATYSGPCNSSNSAVTIEGPTVYGMVSPGTYTVWSGGELFSGGGDMISEQSLESSSSCVVNFGKGWRLPTDDEVGHVNSNVGTGHGYDIGYEPSQIRTSVLFPGDPTRRWHVNGNTFWENDGYTYSSKEVRCVFGR